MLLHRYDLNNYHLESQGIYTGPRWAGIHTVTSVPDPNNWPCCTHVCIYTHYSPLCTKEFTVTHSSMWLPSLLGKLMMTIRVCCSQFQWQHAWFSNILITLIRSPKLHTLNYSLCHIMTIQVCTIFIRFVNFCWDKVRFYPGDLRVGGCTLDTSQNIYKLQLLQSFNIYASPFIYIYTPAFVYN